VGKRKAAEKPKSAALVLRDNKAALQQIEKVVEECSLSKLVDMSAMEQTLTLADGMQQLRELLTDDVMEAVSALQGTKLGFNTDKKDHAQGYTLLVVRDCLIEATIRGLRSVGNEWNIIAGNCYVTLEGLTRLVNEAADPGSYEQVIGLPHTKLDSEGRGSALIECHATWKINGVADSQHCDPANPEGETEAERMDTRIPVKVNKGMGIDAMLGKAKRKLLALVWAKITKTHIPEGEPDDMPDDAVDVSGAPVLTQGEETKEEHPGRPVGDLLDQIPDVEPDQGPAPQDVPPPVQEVDGDREAPTEQIVAQLLQEVEIEPEAIRVGKIVEDYPTVKGVRQVMADIARDQGVRDAFLDKYGVM
jgi:hypothetical protein